jgi:hypothetical protein
MGMFVPSPVTGYLKNLLHPKSGSVALVGACGCGTLRGARNLASATLRSFLSSLSSLTLEEIFSSTFH